MRIIDKQKDFYDFLVWKYGEDKEIIFDRRNSFPLKPKIFKPNFQEIINKNYYYKTMKETDLLFHYILVIWDELIHIFKWKEKLFTQFNLIEEKDNKYINWYIKYLFSDKKEYFIFSNFSEKNWCKIIDIKDLLNKDRKYFFEEESLKEIPILFKQITDFNFKEKIEEIFINPNLKELGIFLDPDFVWQNIYNFLLKIKTEKENYHEARNDEKIYNKWFDLKTSFRPKMKNKK